ncbi:hypothetical protein Q3G72_027024 [Acer saccharum]|nr:hypothetical protein Q3G72_027024 [Acer saccharum]
MTQRLLQADAVSIHQRANNNFFVSTSAKGPTALYCRDIRARTKPVLCFRQSVRILPAETGLCPEGEKKATTGGEDPAFLTYTCTWSSSQNEGEMP